MNNKLCIIINGKGGVGKDTLCEMAAQMYKVHNISSITPIKEIARSYGWQGEKDLKSRRFLAELKRVFVEYNDLPNNYLISEYNEFLQSENDILFVHIREKHEIEKFKKSTNNKPVTLLVTRNSLNKDKAYGNKADDFVEDFSYDYIFDNSLPILESKGMFISLIQKIILDKRLNITGKKFSD
ncbi:MAG TPA: hypothetical protein VFC76_00925 [Oscillospiraceae bacterium]|nr:hypothetical protein [Oscillospiraceae bacterium]